MAEVVYIFDNGSSNFAEIARLTRIYPSVVLRGNSTNLGISYALNRLFEFAASDHYEWVLLLDQDSVCGPGMVGAIGGKVEDGVAIVCPSILDRNLTADLRGLPSYPVEVAQCITSGSLCRVEAWRYVGGYDERMFIDYVDFDLCLRLKLAGYRILLDSSAYLVHELGAARKKWRMTSYNYSSFRLRHMAHDVIYFDVKHRDSPRSLKPAQRGVAGHVLKFLQMALLIVAFEQDKREKVFALLQGLAAGLFERR